jgi:cell division protein FtsW
VRERTPGTQYDLSLLIITISLMGIGVVIVYSASAILAAERFGDGYYFLKKQALFGAFALCMMMVMMNLPYHLLRRLAYPILGLGLVLLVLLLIPGIGYRVGGSTRWIRFAQVSFQPSEFAKLALIIFLAYFLEKKGDRIRTFSLGFLPVLIIAGTMIYLVILQPDFGVALFLATMVFMLLFIGGARISYLVSSVVLALPVIYLLITKVDYRYNRIATFLNPWEDPSRTSFQMVQSLLAFGSGGLFGTGLGGGSQKLFFLPAPHTDFIFSVIGEELGMVGVTIILGLFILFTIRGIRIALMAEDPFGTFLAAGITAMISMQAIINMGVVLGLLPTKGLTLPFISYGGTSLLINGLGVGILLNISSKAGRT